MQGRTTSSQLARAAIAAAALACAACSFDVPGIDLGSITAIDMSAAGDGPPPDFPRGAFVPSNVSPTLVQDGAASLVGPHDIDTEKLLIDGQPPAVGVVFTPELTHDEWAVLAVRDFTINVDVTVHGRRGLIVIAVGDARISAVLHAEAVTRTPGPGGQFTGAGHGGDGKTSGTADSGGGGAGHAALGATGGASGAPTDGEGGLGGPSYLGALFGGSGGGTGAGTSSPVSPCPAGKGYSLGGGGGGILQISAKGTIDIVAGGGINAGGGGGRGGCLDAASAGGGGGSGGTIWLEAPMMRILGKLAANGGGGGSGGRGGILIADDGYDGTDALLDSAAAPGGASRGSDSGAGGAGGGRATDAVGGDKALNAGGGGGAVGRIRLRTTAVAPVTDPGTVESPPPELTVDF